jgi:hypothetical protein
MSKTKKFDKILNSTDKKNLKKQKRLEVKKESIKINLDGSLLSSKFLHLLAN